MKALFYPSKAYGTAKVPPSKSLTHRALICAALTQKTFVKLSETGPKELMCGEEKQQNVEALQHETAEILLSDDINATIECLKTLGTKISFFEKCVEAGGLKHNYKNETGMVLNCAESASTLRFLIPLCLLTGTPVKFTGRGKLMERPLSVYEDICRKQGISFIKAKDSVSVCGKLSPGDYEIPGNISSQFISGLMFALPLLNGDSTLRISGKTESTPYINMTIKVLSDFGIIITKIDNIGRKEKSETMADAAHGKHIGMCCKEAKDTETVYYIKGNQAYKSPGIYEIEGDCSNGAYLDAFNELGGNVTLEGMPDKSFQADSIYKKYFGMLKTGMNGSTFSGTQYGLPHFDLSDCPDLGPVLFSIAACKQGAVFVNYERLKLKESDRVAAMKEELEKFGAIVTEHDSCLFIHKGEMHKPKKVLSSHNDHRIVMALSLLCSIYGGEIDGAEAVNKSFPDYFDILQGLHVNVSVNVD